MELFLIIALFLVAVVIFFLFSTPQHKEKSKFDKKAFYDEQKERVSLGGYGAQPLLNKTEQIARKAIWKAIYEAKKNKELTVFAQVSLGEMLTHQNRQLYRDINSKRVDFVVTDSKFMPVLVIEIHGQGHYNQSATARDVVKREAVESANIIYLAVAVGSNEEAVYEAVFNAVKERV